MVEHNLPETVYHGTDAQSAADIEQIGLDDRLRAAAAGGCGADMKGFSVSAKRKMAEDWAAIRAGERGSAVGVVLEADAASLPLQRGRPGWWTDPDEFFIDPADFSKVGPGVFRKVGEVAPIP